MKSLCVFTIENKNIFRLSNFEMIQNNISVKSAPFKKLKTKRKLIVNIRYISR